MSQPLTRRGNIIGFSSMNTEGYLHSMFVHKDWQHKGVASMLLSEVEKMALGYGVHKISAEVSITARPFFEKHGYKMVKEQKAKANRLYLTNYVMKKRVKLLKYEHKNNTSLPKLRITYVWRIYVRYSWRWASVFRNIAGIAFKKDFSQQLRLMNSRKPLPSPTKRTCRPQ